MQIRYSLGIYTIIKYVWNLKAVIYDQYNINYADIINFTIGLLKNNQFITFIRENVPLYYKKSIKITYIRKMKFDFPLLYNM